MDQYLLLFWLIPLGFLAGGYGTLIGAGGGFVLAPALLLLYPTEAPETVTSISLAVVFFMPFREASPMRGRNESITNLELFSPWRPCQAPSWER